jgi:hypothetical protein
MAVNNYLLQSAQRKDCLLALLPCLGGVVPSLLDPSKQVYPEFNSNPSGTSWAERNGLITMQNIAIRNNIFTAADPSQNASIKTQLDFQNNNSSKTFITKMMFHKISDGKLHISPIFSQGFYTSSTARYVFNFTFRENESVTFFNISYSAFDQSKFGFTYIVKDSFFDCWHIVALVYDCRDPLNSVSELFIDGESVKHKRFSHLTWNTPLPPYNTAMGIREDVETPYLSDNQLAWAIIFDSALSAEEITMFK